MGSSSTPVCFLSLTGHLGLTRAVRTTAIFRPAFPYASSRNLRLVAITLPEYPGSYRLSDDQLAKLASYHAEDQASVFLDQSKDIAGLIAHIIKIEGLHPPSEKDGVRTGGVSILAWSAGNAFLLSLLANTDALDPEAGSLLERYVTSVIFYGE